jgi:hypothetical protein
MSDWGKAVLNIVHWGADAQQNGQEATNLLTENNNFLITETNEDFLIEEQTIYEGGVNAMYDYSWSGQTLLSR